MAYTLFDLLRFIRGQNPEWYLPPVPDHPLSPRPVKGAPGKGISPRPVERPPNWIGIPTPVLESGGGGYIGIPTPVLPPGLIRGRPSSPPSRIPTPVLPPGLFPRRGGPSSHDVAFQRPGLPRNPGGISIQPFPNY